MRHVRVCGLAAVGLLAPEITARHHHPAVNRILQYHKELTHWAKDVVTALDLARWVATEDSRWAPESPLRFGSPPLSAGPAPTPQQSPAITDGITSPSARLPPAKFAPEADSNPTDVDCGLGLAVWDSPEIKCGDTEITAVEYISQQRDDCQISGRKTCICPKDSLYYQWNDCNGLRQLECTPVLIKPELTCPPPSTSPSSASSVLGPLGDPVCLAIDRRQSVTFGYRLRCANAGPILTADPDNPKQTIAMEAMNPADVARLQNAPYLSADGQHYATPEWYRDNFKYALSNDDGSLVLSAIVPSELPNEMYLKIWDFINLSDNVNRQYRLVTTQHIAGRGEIAFDVDFARVDDNFLVGGRAYLETGFDSHLGVHRLLVDINNYLIRHKPITAGQIWLGILILALSVGALSCCCFLGWKGWRMWRKHQEKALLNDSKQD